MNYAQIYNSWREHPEDFWMSAAKAVDWDVFPTKALNISKAPFSSWFDDGVTNTCHNALDRHVNRGLGNKTAIIYDSPVTGEKNSISFY